MPLAPLTTDGLLYHLPFAVEFAKTRSIDFTPIFFNDISMTYYPQGGTIFYLFTMYSGKEFLLKFTQLPFIFMGAISLYLISEENGFSKLSRIGIFCIFCLIKPIIKESFLCYVDILMATSFISALYCFSSKRKNIVPMGILSAALLMSIKNYVLIYLILIIPFIFLKKKGKIPKKLLFLSIIFFLFAGCFTYIRNFLIIKNPLFPANISLGNITIFQGLLSFHKKTFIESLKTIFELFMNPISDVDPSKYISFILFFSLLISIPLSLFKKDKTIFYILLTVPLSILIYIVAIPSVVYQIRHLLPIYGALSLSVGYLFKDTKKLQFLPFVLCGFLVINNLIAEIAIFQTIFLASILFIIFIFFYKKKKYLLSFVFPICIFLMLLGWTLTLTSDMYNNTKYETWKMFYGAKSDLWKFINENSQQPKNISYIGDFLIYPFYGNNYQNNILYQSINSIETIPIHKMSMEEKLFSVKDFEKLYRKDFSYQLWRTGLETKKVDWIILKNDRFYLEKEWIQKNLDSFQMIFSNEFATIYATTFY